MPRSILPRKKSVSAVIFTTCWRSTMKSKLWAAAFMTVAIPAFAEDVEDVKRQAARKAEADLCNTFRRESQMYNACWCNSTLSGSWRHRICDRSPSTAKRRTLDHAKGVCREVHDDVKSKGFALCVKEMMKVP